MMKAVPPTRDTPSNQDDEFVAHEAPGGGGYAQLPKQVWEWVCWTGSKTFDGLDFAGEVLANFLGLTQSQYQWIIDMQEREKEEKRQRRLEARQRRQLRLERLLEEEKRKLEELESGGPEQNLNDPPSLS